LDAEWGKALDSAEILTFAALRDFAPVISDCGDIDHPRQTYMKGSGRVRDDLPCPVMSLPLLTTSAGVLTLTHDRKLRETDP